MRIFGNIIEFLKSNPTSKWNSIFAYLFRIIGRNNITGASKNTILLNSTYVKKTSIKIEGVNNIIDLSKGSNYIINSKIYINGSNNNIVLGIRNYFDGADLYIEDDGGTISFGDHNRIFGCTHIAVIEGQTVSFGDGCLFSDNVVFRTGDSHTIIDINSKKRINLSKSISVGNRVWFGNTSTILKGVTISDDSIIGTCSLVTKDVPTNSVVAGNPAKVIKSGVSWQLQRVPVE